MPDVPVESGPDITRRNLPHWTYDGSIYFVTWRIIKGTEALIPDERTLVAEAIRRFHKERYFLFAWVVMNDHVHSLFRLHGNQTLSRVIHSWKSFTANRLQRQFGRRGSVWQEESHDHIVRNEREFYDTVRYILHNPWKRWQVEEYPWVGFNPAED